MAKGEGYTHIHCFTHCLDSLVRNFLCHHHSVQIILGTAKAICSHFQSSVEARGLLTQLQRQHALPAHQLLEELLVHWVLAYHLPEWLVEQQQPLEEYKGRHQLGKAGVALLATFWSLADSLSKLLQPFQMAVREASVVQASLSQVLPQLRSLHIFLEQVHGHFQEQSVGEAGAAIQLAKGLALQLCTDCQLNELFYREEFVLATLLDSCFKGKIEAILPVGADIDYWKQVLVYKVKEIRVSEYSLTAPSPLQSPRGLCTDLTWVARSCGVERKSQGSLCRAVAALGPSCWPRGRRACWRAWGCWPPRGVGTRCPPRATGPASLSRRIWENETVGAQDDPLASWEKKQEAWPPSVCLTPNKRLL